MFLHFGYVDKRLDKKAMVNFKIPDWTKIITTHILPDISRNQGNQTVKFGQLTEYNMRNIFLAKSYTECGGEVSPRLFYKKLKLNMPLN